MDFTKLFPLTLGVLELLKREEHLFQPAYFVPAPESAPLTMQLYVRPSKKIYDTFGLMSVLAFAINERVNLSLNRNHQAKFLKNTNINELYTLMDLHRLLADYRFIKYLGFNKEQATIGLTNCLDLPRLRQALTDFNVTDLLVTSINKKGKKYLQLHWRGGLVIEMGIQSVIFHFHLPSVSAIYDGIDMCAELITLIEEEYMFLESSDINLADFQPFIEMSAPQLFSKEFLQILKEAASILEKGDIPAHFRETKKSRLTHHGLGKRCFSLPKDYLGEHLDYVIYTEEKNRLAIKFSLDFDWGEINKRLKERGLSVKEKKSKSTDTFRIKTGGSSRQIHQTYKYLERSISRNGVEIMVLCGNHILELPIKAAEDAWQLTEEIYYRRLFISSWLPRSDRPCDLSDYERQVIKNMQKLFTIYNFFIRPALEREYGDAVLKKIYEEENDTDTGPETDPAPPAAQWYYGQLQALSPESDYFERFNALLLQVQEIIMPLIPELSQYSEENRRRSMELYGQLSQMIGVSTSFINDYKPLQKIA